MTNTHEIRESIVLENEGEKIFAILHRPLNPNPCPAVLFCHGFAGQKTGKHKAYVVLAEELAKVGVASLRIDFRGCGDSEGSLVNSRLESQVQDALLALDFLAEHPLIDATKLGIFGRSLGGAIAVIAANRYQTTKSSASPISLCLALWAPLFSAQPFAKSWTKPWANELLLLKKGTPIIVNGQQVGLPFLKDLLEMKLETELFSLKDLPLLHIHGENDKIIGAEQAQNYRACREDASADTLFLSLPKSDHDFSDCEERNEATVKTVAWFRSTLTRVNHERYELDAKFKNGREG